MAKKTASRAEAVPAEASESPEVRSDTLQVENDAEEKKVFRPSDIPQFETLPDGKQGKPIDGAKWLREGGHPNPKRRYRITGKGPHGAELGPVEVEGVDESEAISTVFQKAKIRETHRWRMKAVCIAE